MFPVCVDSTEQTVGFLSTPTWTCITSKKFSDSKLSTFLNQVSIKKIIKLVFSAMSKSYKSERDLKEKQKLFKLGVVGIPFSHSTSIQGNPMRSGDFKSSSKYHKHCSKEP